MSKLSIMTGKQPHRIRTITDFHAFRGLPKPEHPLVSVINLESVKKSAVQETNLILDFYSIALKRNLNAKLKYGQQEYDFDEGTMFFISPGQVFRIEAPNDTQLRQSGCMLLIHLDFLWNTPLARTIRLYEYFEYSANEALFLSEKEEGMVLNLLQQIQQEYHSNIDTFSQSIIIAQIELLLNYSERFYHRQFITRKITNHKILNRLEDILTVYFKNDNLMENGLPTVQHIAEKLSVSPNYLSGLLKVLTGQNTQQHIHNKLIEKAKEKLSTTDLSVIEIAFDLGFEHPQSFNRLFKKKTNQTPLQFRRSFQ